MPTARAAQAFLVSALFLVPSVATGEDPRCLAADPNEWPAPSRPYFMLAVDTSGSMTSCTTPPSTFPATCNPLAPGYKVNACGLVPTRLNDAKCAVRDTVLGFGGQVSFGLATYAIKLSGCATNCTGCTGTCFTLEKSTTGNCTGCGPRSGNATTRAGAFIRVPMQVDAFWSTPTPSNVPELLSWVDGDCTNNVELVASGSTPLNGMLRDMGRYFAAGWSAPDGSVTFPTPLSTSDLAGPGVNGSTGCRNLNVILVTDGDETCDAQSDAVAAAASLYQGGVTIGGKTFKIRTHVVNFAGGTQANTDAIAAAGGTGKSIFASNGGELGSALSAIVATAVKAETCNNGDDNCNGCTDEGYRHYCNTDPACCPWSDSATRSGCLTSYLASVQASPPSGDTQLLPCTSSVQASVPATWLCYDPGDRCNGSDDNCQSGIDENQTKCGSPAHCPSAETCNGIDDDCNGQTDEGVCANCVPSAEVCDGCDNDCDGIVDDPPAGGFAALACGLAAPPNCAGTAPCKAAQSVVAPGTCIAGAGFGACTNTPNPETCNGVDDDCNGVVDDGYVSVACIPSSHPAGLVYGAGSPCTKGTTQCVGGKVACVGGAGPTSELCDGIDNDCDGTTDDGVPGLGKLCGPSSPPCKPGLTACEAGQLVCKGGVPPTSETCDGKDNDCDGTTDEAPLADAPLPGKGGCWSEAGACCSFANLSWCPPLGADCHGVGLLGSPCGQGSLSCGGAAGWQCLGAKAPMLEVCDGIDNDCDQTVDEEPLPLVGGSCGLALGACKPGLLACVMGGLDCMGDQGPTDELCNGIDDDCDGETDEGIPASGTCAMPYDTNAFPGDRSNFPCNPGLLECNGEGAWVCVGGTSPGPEECNGIDDDCDGGIDETGAAPDGLDGSANPFAPPVANLGDACGSAAGACEPGAFACVGGSFACVGAVAPTFESCNCSDDDCDGATDEVPGPNEPALCSPGKSCVAASGTCQCAAPCAGGEYVCPPGQKCVVAKASDGSAPTGYCVVDYDSLCGNCAAKTVAGEFGSIGCGPAGTDPESCNLTPVCQCKGPNGCREPCFNVSCGAGQVCARYGANAGTCVDDTCENTGCEGCNRSCKDGVCVVVEPTGNSGGAGSSDANATTTGGAPLAPPFRGGRLANETCSCDAVGGATGPSRASVVMLLALALAARRLGHRHARRNVARLALALMVAGCTANLDEVGGAGTGDTQAGDGAGGAGGALFSPSGSGGLDLGGGGGSGCVFTNGGVELCDGKDNDCDGLIDEDFDFQSIKRCGTCTNDCFADLLNTDPKSIVCAWNGVPNTPGSCSFTACALDYVDLDPNKLGCEYYCAKTAEADALCNHKDDDCDGSIDEDVNRCSDPQNCGECGHACTIVHGTGACVHPDDKAPCDLANTSCELALCDDDDGDGSPDWWNLDKLGSTGCEYPCSLTNGGVEQCGDGIDNDCDGRIDGADDLSKDPEIGVTCYADPDGLCAAPAHAGLTECVGNHVVCSGPALLAQNQNVETCNGIDDNCDGVVDNDATDAGGFCGTSNVYPCAFGKLLCENAALVCVGAVAPGTETCNGIDDDCDGKLDLSGVTPPSDASGPCNVPPKAPAGATTPCQAGQLACTGGVTQCVGAIGPTSATDGCGVDSNCDGTLDGQPNLLTDVHHCGTCSNDCTVNAVHATFSCQSGKCAFQSCELGWHDLDANGSCEYGCVMTGAEACDGKDNDCNGKVDDGVSPPAPSKVCGTSVAATRPECTSEVLVTCVSGSWQCTFPSSVCSPSCAAATELCDGKDNDCDGSLNENVPNYGLACASDDGLPFPGHGACRTTGNFVCDGAGQTKCSATKADCATLPGGCAELCDGKDNDCDGSVDEPFAAKGSNAAFFVKPDVTELGPGVFAFSFEASRPTATATSPGSGNGYFCTGASCPSWLPVAPSGTTLDETPACSTAGKLPWFNVTPVEAEQTCDAIGGHVCSLADWQSACRGPSACKWGYAPRGAACTSKATALKFCNLAEYDYSTSFAGDQNGLLPGGSALLPGCGGDFTNLYGNTTPYLRDVTGNLREIVIDEGTNTYRLMGGGFGTSEAGATCDFTFYSVASSFQLYDTGFRCCFDTDPRQ